MKQSGSADPFASLLSSPSSVLPAPLTPSSPAPTSSVAARTSPSPSSPAFQSISINTPVKPSAAQPSLESLVGQPAKKKEIRRLPKEIIKSGEYGPEYEEWKRKQEEMERQKLAQAVSAIGAATTVVAVPASGAPSGGVGSGVAQPKAPKAPRGNRIKMQVVERGVPLKKWLLVKWSVAEGAENDSVCVFEEDVSVSNEIWSLPLSSIKTKGTTHCAYPAQSIGRYFAAYLRENGTLVCQSRTLVVGPKVACKAEVRENKIRCTYAIEASAQSSWDWVGLYIASQRCYQDYHNWNYVNMSADHVLFDLPVTPGEYVCCYFSASRKFCPLAFSNPVVVPDINSIFVKEAEVKVNGGALTVTFNIKSNPRDHSDWVGLYRVHDYKKHQYLAYAVCELQSNTVSLTVPPQVEPGEYVVRYISMSAQPLTGGGIITASNVVKVVA